MFIYRVRYAESHGPHENSTGLKKRGFFLKKKIFWKKKKIFFEKKFFFAKKNFLKKNFFFEKNIYPLRISPRFRKSHLEDPAINIRTLGRSKREIRLKITFFWVALHIGQGQRHYVILAQNLGQMSRHSELDMIFKGTLKDSQSQWHAESSQQIRRLQGNGASKIQRFGP